MTVAPNVPDGVLPPPSGGPRAYHEAREVRVRAAVAEPADSPEIKKALIRLGRALASGQPLAADVPRGYYLNIRV